MHFQAVGIRMELQQGRNPNGAVTRLRQKFALQDAIGFLRLLRFKRAGV
jgi:hypothetical protein